MRYSEEQRRNSKINREELDLYIQRNYVETDMLFAAMSAPATMSASASISAPDYIPAMSPAEKVPYTTAASSAKESVPVHDEAEASPKRESLPGEDSSVKKGSEKQQKRSGLLGMISGNYAGRAGKNAICDSVPFEDRSEAIYEKAAKPIAEPAKKRADSAKIKKEEISEDTADEQLSDACQDLEESRDNDYYCDYDDEDLYKKLAERVSHVEDSFSDYLMFLIGSKGLNNADVYKRALVDKKVFSKIKNNPDYHPQKLTAMCLCIGAMLNLDESRDLLARAGYALSPSDKTDIIFSYFIENEIYDMIELDIQLEEHGLECIIA